MFRCDVRARVLYARAHEHAQYKPSAAEAADDKPAGEDSCESGYGLMMMIPPGPAAAAAAARAELLLDPPAELLEIVAEDTETGSCIEAMAAAATAAAADALLVGTSMLSVVE